MKLQEAVRIDACPPRREKGFETKCVACDGPVAQKGRGRPRKYCDECLTRDSRASMLRAWRQLNPERVERYNAARRKPPPSRPAGFSEQLREQTRQRAELRRRLAEDRP